MALTDRQARGFVVFLLLAQLLLLTSQIGPTRTTPPIERAVLRIVGPFALWVTAAQVAVADLPSSFRHRWSLHAEIRVLSEQVERLRRDNLRLRALEAELEQMRELVPIALRQPGEASVAEVVYVDHTSWLRSLIVFTGDLPAVGIDRPVVAAQGLVGRTIATSGAFAKVQLVTDRSSAVGAMVERTRRQGVVRGTGGELALDYVPLQADVRPGDLIVTAGIDGVYPRGIPLGTVAGVTPGPGLFHSIRLAPSADFARLDLVFLLDLDEPPDTLTREEPLESP